MLWGRTWGKGHSPRSNVEGSVHDHNHLDVQSVPLGAVPSWLVAHKHRILFCICEKKRWGKRGRGNQAKNWQGRERRGAGHRTKPYLSQSMPPLSISSESVILGKPVIDGCSGRMIKLQFHFQMIISLDFCFSVSPFLTCPFFWGLNLQVNPLHEGALFFQFSFHLL